LLLLVAVRIYENSSDLDRFGHSEGTMIAPRIAVDSPDKVRNIVLMGAVANTLKDLLYFQIVS